MNRQSLPSRRLYDSAQAQGRFFTTSQARAAGFKDNVHLYHVRAGNWVRERRGIYRMAQFPTSARPDLMLWQLWSYKTSRGTARNVQPRSGPDPALALLRGAGLLTGDYWRHDFRRTIATGMTTAGLPSTIVNKVMNQQEGGPSVTKIYDRYSYDKEKRHALDTWGRHLDTLIGTGSLGRVVPFPR